MLLQVCRKIALAAGLVLTSVSPSAAQNWDGVVSGKIVRIDVTAGSNFGFRIYLNNSSTTCGTGGVNWAYLLTSDDNYEAYVAVLNSAWLASKNVTLYTTKDSYGYCKLGYLVAGS
jgi:hypothetical protein